ncbi:MAG TPA: hypothetical protein IAB40_04330 [Candidatus Onthocola stercoravium]|nr:hypothetical protein [Candidatus Onthocola stercoravium]
MNFYYDIVVNFQENNYMFYEWAESDVLEYIKRVPIFQVTTKVLRDLINNNIEVDKEFLDSIYNKTKLKKGFLEYVSLFVSKNGAIVLEFASDGKVIARSGLQVNDECNVMEVIYTLPIFRLEYKVLNRLELNKDLRLESTIKDFINLEINTLYKNKEWEKIVFLYNEWFLKSDPNVGEMVQEMQNRLKGEITDREFRIYNLIKLSYNNV